MAAAGVLFIAACGSESPSAPAEPPDDEAAGSHESTGAATSEVATSEVAPAVRETEPWLRELLAFDLIAQPTDARTIALGERLRSPVSCPQPGTGCFVELTLSGYTAQVHIGDDRAIQVWGPTQPFAMVPWVAGVEEQIDHSPLTQVNETGTRPDRLWRDSRHVVLLHDHSTQDCGGFCPSMIWIAAPDHAAAPGYGFPAQRR